MKFLSGLIQPQYVPCSGGTRLEITCITYSKCKGIGNEKGYVQYLIDTRDGTICQEKLEYCNC